MSIILFIHGALGSKNQFEKIENSLDNKFETYSCLLYTSDAADERSSVDLGGRRIIKKKKHKILRV